MQQMPPNIYNSARKVVKMQNQRHKGYEAFDKDHGGVSHYLVAETGPICEYNLPKERKKKMKIMIKGLIIRNIAQNVNQYIHSTCLDFIFKYIGILQL